VARILSRKRNGLPAPDVVALLAQELRGFEKQPKRLDLIKVGGKLGLTVQYKVLRVDALLKETESGYIAILNSTTNKSRQRFSLAHELGHLVLYNVTGLTEAFGHISSPEKQNGGASEVEDLCDLFAAELLMPLTEWKQQIFAEGISLKVIKRLMSRYGVSMPAAARRIIEADIWKCAIVTWEPIYTGDLLIELNRVGCWENIISASYSWPKSIPNNQEFCIAGSPLCALEKRTETIGKITLPFDAAKGKYLAQSDILMGEKTRVATIAIPERYGWDVILRSRRPSSR
jgi:Zn-dependent peptidase ImmA (M78 family)